MLTSASLFAGGEGFGLGAQAAGLDHIWGLEYKDNIAAVARMNGFNVIPQDILTADPLDFPAPWHLHMSPPCQEFSNNNKNQGEKESDRAMALACCRFIEVMGSELVTVENVPRYAGSLSWGIISQCLIDRGYTIKTKRLNAANFGVPQTRKRFIAIARKTGDPRLPQPTHAKPAPGRLPLFPNWIGWQEATAGLKLEKRPFAPWHIRSLPPTITGPILTNAGNAKSNERRRYRSGREPAKTITSSCFAMRAVFVPDGETIATDSEEIKQYTYGVSGDFIKALQGFPKGYNLPTGRGLAAVVLGNAVPPLLVQVIVEANIKK